MKIKHKTAQPGFNARAGKNDRGKGLLILQTPYMSESVSIMADCIDHVYSLDGKTIVLHRTNNNPHSKQEKHSFTISFDLFMRAYLASERAGITIDLRPACNIPRHNYLYKYNGGKSVPEKPMRELMRLANCHQIYKP